VQELFDEPAGDVGGQQRIAGVTVAAAASSPPQASKHRAQPIQLVAKQTGSTLLGLAAPGHGPVGNQFLSTDDLYRPGRKVGDDATVCQFMADLGQAGAASSAWRPCRYPRAS
jgi:hypothetical protein